jgi:hypothetical protein
LAACAMILFTGCTTDFDVLDDWKETTVIYGVLNQNDTAHYIKVSKAFLGEGDAYMMAQEFDSLYYDTADIVVTLTEVQTGNVEILMPDFSIPKNMNDDPIFGQKQVLYKTKMALNKDFTYQVKMKNLVTGNEVVSQTNLVKPFTVLTPQGTSTTVDFVNPNSNFEVKWSSAVNGKRYNVIVRFFYHEHDKISNVTDTTKFIDFNLGEIESPDPNGGDEMKLAFERSDFYKNFDGKLVADAKYERYPKGVQFLFYVAADELNTYMQVSAPSTGIVQERPSYTNITNGIGIFSARYNQRANSAASNNPYYPFGFKLNPASLDSLCIGSQTAAFNFCDPAEFNPNDPCFCEP